MIWLLIIAAIIVVSFFLALRSMRNFQEVPPNKYPYGVFLIQNVGPMQNGILAKLYEFCLEANAIVSLEKLFKGSQHALVIFAPQNIIQFIPDLELLEIEDYLPSVDEVIVWSLQPKNENELTVPTPFLTDFPLEENQQLFWQLVLCPHKNTQHFQVNIRVMVVGSDVHKRIESAKALDTYLKETIGLQKKESDLSITSLFNSYQKRSLVPSEIEGFVLSTQKIKELL